MEAVYAREARVTYQKRDVPAGERIVGSRISDSAGAAAQVRHAIGAPTVEHFVAVALNSRNEAIGWSTIAIGTETMCAVAPSEVCRFALLAGAAALVVGHNHPSGDPNPSSEDIALTERLGEAMRLLGIRLLDHVIVGDGSGRSFSFLDAGILATYPRSR